MPYLTDAPLEVLHLILYNVDQQNDLYQCALVNKSLYAATNPLLWREPKLLACGSKRKDSISFWLLRSFRQARIHGLHATSLGHFIRTLSIRRCTTLQDMRQVINNVPLVEELAIDVSTMKDKDMKRIAIKCPQLKRLSLRFLTDGSDRFFEPLRHCTNLRELSIIKVLRSLNQLKSLKHSGLEKLTVLPYYCFDELSLVSTFGDMPALTHLDMAAMTEAYFRHYQTLPSPTLFPGLTDLRIAMPYHTTTTDDAMVSFFKAHPLICTLSIEGMIIDPVIMTSLASDLVHLKRLSFINNGHLPPLTKSLPLVEKLTVRDCHMNVDSTVRMAMYLPNIHYIYVGKYIYSSRHFNRNFVGDILQANGPTVESRTHLKHLDFASHDSVPGDLKVYLPRRMDGKLIQEDLEHIRKTALGLVWIE